MPRVSLRRVLSKLTVLALTTSSMGLATARSRDPIIDEDVDVDPDADTLDADTMIDTDYIEREDAGLALGRSLALALAELRPMDATHMVATWTLSDDPLRRLAVATALEWSFPLVGDALVIDHLSRDGDAGIRAAAARAAGVRRTKDVDPDVLARLGNDPDPEVRAAALRHA
jgi:hypothetical protein